MSRARLGLGLPRQGLSTHARRREVELGATIVSSQFEGKTKIQQHQMVYRVLGSKVGNEIHALGLTTQIPGEKR